LYNPVLQPGERAAVEKVWKSGANPVEILTAQK
jgi:hypothetical protein